MIYVKEKAYLTNYTYNQSIEIKELLTISNPTFLKKTEMGLSLWGIDPTVKFYEELDKQLIVPIGVVDQVSEILNHPPIQDARFTALKPLTVEFTGKLHDYQDKAVQALVGRSLGVLEAMTGSGKTVMICALIAKIKQPTLILVHTKELKDQFVDKLKQFTTLTNIGVIGDSEYNVQDVTVALLQTMNTLDDKTYEELNKRFGMVYLDEAHIAPAQTFYSVLNRLAAKYKYGGSATLKRADGMSPAIFFALGPVLHTVTNFSEFVTKISHVPIETNYFFPMISSDEYTVMMGDLVADQFRNEFIIEQTRQYTTSKVYLSTRVEQLEQLQKLLNDGIILTSKTPKKQREQIIEDFKTAKIKTVFSTYQLFATGLDIAHLEYAIFAAPIRSEILVRQAAGRLMRLYKGKKPQIIDFVDSQIPILRNQARSRARVIKNLLESL